jgi:lipid A 3-O-deacylase
MKIILALLLFTSLLPGSVSAAESEANDATKNQEVKPKDQELKPWVRKVAFGLLWHDIGFISDQQEHGLDPNWEVQFNRPEWKWWRWIGSPFTMVGATPNFNGYTSAFYLGLNWELSLSSKFFDQLTNNFSKRLWFSGGVSTAVHTGPLRKNDIKCEQDGNCGFGSRVLPRIQLELGANFWTNHAISLFFDHMSHGQLGCSCIQNEGIDHTGIRYHFIFNGDSKP